MDSYIDREEKHPRVALFHNNLGTSYRLLFDRFGDKQDLQQAILHHQVAVNLTPECHQDKSSRLSSLGSLFLAQFQKYGDVSDLLKAIEQYWLSKDLILDTHYDKPACYNNLGTALHTHF